MRGHRLGEGLPQEPPAAAVGAQQGGERQALFGPERSGGPGIGQLQRQAAGAADHSLDGLAEGEVDPVAQLGLAEQRGVRGILGQRPVGEPVRRHSDPAGQVLAYLLDDPLHDGQGCTGEGPLGRARTAHVR
ncbi:hypothetical protein [Streptomyces sp. ISL-86]|uniref:hypothetical protein n=1 Tax=Streptomyces sp. ISL-86 TaxID=2819187 RepID=UPI001BE9B3FF|nr:hypothetical protein [Streptomyces sp. ISL-86]MBT2457802.1 hypothetical protein [Streptomyces sp. ISL-86]